MTTETRNLTKKAIESLTPRASRYAVNDEKTPHLRLIVHPSGKRSWQVYKSHQGKPVKITLGPFPEWLPEHARKEAARILGQLARGENPNEQKRVQRETKPAEVLTLRKAFADYCAAKALRPSTVRAYHNAVEKHLAEYTDRPLIEITPQVVMTVYGKVSKDSPSAANSAMRALRALWSFCYDEDDPAAPRNPVRVLSRKKLWRKVERRLDYIPPEKLGDWLRAVEDLPALMTDPKADPELWRDLFAVWALTGCRNEEAKGLVWDDVNLPGRTLVLRETKNKKDHVLPITTHLAMVLERRWAATGGKGRGNAKVFPRSHHRDAWGHVLEAAGIEKLSPHDLRRTYAFAAERAGLGVYQIKQLLNHSAAGDVTAGYAQVGTVEALREPAEKVAAWIMNHKRAQQNVVVADFG